MQRCKADTSFQLSEHFRSKALVIAKIWAASDDPMANRTRSREGWLLENLRNQLECLSAARNLRLFIDDLRSVRGLHMKAAIRRPNSINGAVEEHRLLRRSRLKDRELNR